MKKIAVILIFIIGVFLLMLTYTSWFPFGQNETQAKVDEKVDMIEIDVSGVNTTIIPENRDDVHAKLKGQGNVTVKQSGDQINVQYKSKKWFNGFSLFNKKKLTIYIPEDYDRNIAIDSGSGSLTFSEKSKNEPMQVENFSLNMTSGNVHLRHLSTTHFEQEGSSGRIEIDSLATKTGLFKMSSGTMDVKEYTGEVKATLSSGRLNLQMEKVTDAVEIEVNSGFATLDLPTDANFTLKGKISSGTISNDFALTHAMEEKNKIAGIHGSGEHHIDLDVSSGKIELK